jgi:hypothetical protein
MAKTKNKHNQTVGSEVDRSDDRIKSTGEVFTPMSLVYEMIDEIPTEDMQDKTKTFLDNSCGCGNFLVGLYTRLTETYEHTHEEAINRLYGVDLMEDNVKETCKNLNVEYGHPHFVRADGLAYDYSFDGRTYIRTPAEEEAERATLDCFF